MITYPRNQTDASLLTTNSDCRVVDGKLQVKAQEDGKFYELAVLLSEGYAVVVAKGEGQE